MADDEVLQRIAAWQAAGLIDAEIAGRLRAAEAAPGPPPGAEPLPMPSAVGSFFGPAPAIPEIFGYLGAGFVLAAWHVLSLSSRGRANVIEWLLPAVAFSAVGLVLMSRSDRERRAAGVAFGVATAHVFGAAAQVFDPGVVATSANLTICAAIAVVAALTFRRVYPAVLTQLGLLGALATLATVALQWLGRVLFPSTAGPYLDFPPPPDPDAVTKVTLQIAWWLGWALVFGVIGLWEAASRGGTAELASRAGRRASVTRFAAGLTAIVGVTSVIMSSQYSGDGNWGRVLAPWLGDGLVLVIALVLLALAIRRGAMAYLYPAALGVIIAFSDLNAQYVAEQTGTGVALLVEGLILIGAGLAADRVRRRLAAGSRSDPLTPGPVGPIVDA